MTELPLYYHGTLESSKLGSLDSDETILESVAIKWDIFGREWL